MQFAISRVVLQAGIAFESAQQAKNMYASKVILYLNRFNESHN